MVRKLKYHEQKLLKKVDFISWEADNNLHEVKIMKKYRIRKREDYTMYNRLSREIRDVGLKIKELDPEHPFRIERSAMLLEKLYMMGLIETKWDLSYCQKVTASSFCRRRLPVVMVRNKMSQGIKMATQLIEQGHVRVGTEVVKDPAFLVTRKLGAPSRPYILKIMCYCSVDNKNSKALFLATIDVSAKDDKS